MAEQSVVLGHDGCPSRLLKHGDANGTPCCKRPRTVAFKAFQSAKAAGVRNPLGKASMRPTKVRRVMLTEILSRFRRIVQEGAKEKNPKSEPSLPLALPSSHTFRGEVGVDLRCSGG